ncbi:hypothetical protein I350_03143 [Cryptococcus amylolentus CBS 6273]|uniref:Uncharacterized protein n=1 Tax=Cryptococcus amylolentus CBS 6273 TaxID=1296118 RepID=A0A1E3K8T0_9TREE|nr:hypothetical protein I350_03143 [Cryptococcus amylolentus CBS 6273]
MPFSFFAPPHTARPSPSSEHSDFFFPEYPAFDFDGHLSAAGGLDERRESAESASSSGSDEAEADGDEEHDGDGRISGQRKEAAPTPTFTRPSPSRSFSHPVHAPVSSRATRPRGLTPLTPINPHLPSPSSSTSLSSSSSSSTFINPLRPSGPKAQPLARALFARMAEGQGLPALGGGGGVGKGGKKPQKMVVPLKAFKTSFTLDMSASELARR